MKRICAYDNGGETADRYTMVTVSKPYYIAFSSSNPAHPQGVWSCEEVDSRIDLEEPGKFGKRIAFTDAVGVRK